MSKKKCKKTDRDRKWRVKHVLQGESLQNLTGNNWTKKKQTTDMAAFSLNHHLLHGSIWKADINMLCQCVTWNTYVISPSYDTHAFEHFSGLREIPVFYSAGWAVQGTLERAVSVLFFWPRRVWDVEKTAFSMISLKNETFDNCSSVSEFSPLLFLLRLHSLSVETIWCHAVKKHWKKKTLSCPPLSQKCQPDEDIKRCAISAEVKRLRKCVTLI